MFDNPPVGLPQARLNGILPSFYKTKLAVKSLFQEYQVFGNEACDAMFSSCTTRRFLVISKSH